MYIAKVLFLNVCVCGSLEYYDVLFDVKIWMPSTKVEELRVRVRSLTKLVPHVCSPSCTVSYTHKQKTNTLQTSGGTALLSTLYLSSF